MKKQFLQLFLLIILSLVGLFVYSNSYNLADDYAHILELAMLILEACLAFYVYKKFGLKILISMVLVGIFVAFGFVSAIVLLIFSPNRYYQIAFGALAYLQVGVLVYLLLWKREFFKRKKVVIAAVTIAAFLPLAVFSYWEYQDEQVKKVYEARDNLAEYRPFLPDSKVVKLDEQPTLQFTDNLPKVDSATALYPMVAAFVEATYPEGDYTLGKQEILTQTTTRKAYHRLIDGEVDIVFALAPSQEQLAYAEEKGVKLRMVPIGKESFVFFVNKHNPVESLTVEQIKDIYSGKITNWRQVGGNNEEIKAFQRPVNSGSQSALIRLMGDTVLMQAPTEDVVRGMGGIISQTADYKNYKSAIGYTFRYYATKMVANNDIRLLKINGVMPEIATIKSDQYPILETLYIVTTDEEKPNVDRFINWVISAQGQYLVEKTGYVGIN